MGISQLTSTYCLGLQQVIQKRCCLMPEPMCLWLMGLKELIPAHCPGLDAQPCVRRAAQPHSKASYKYNTSGSPRCQGVISGATSLLPRLIVKFASCTRVLWVPPGPPQLAQL